MKFERIAQAAVVAMLFTACTGGEEPVAQPAATTETPVTAAPQDIVQTTTTAAPTTTTAAPATTVPQSLAFASSRDIGRLFEASGSTTARSAPDGDATTALSAGTLVQATAAREIDGTMWVQVRATDADLESLGWLAADDLRPTTQIAIIDNSELFREFRTARVGSSGEDIVRTPGGTDSVATLEQQEIAMHGGSTALDPTGAAWVDVINPASGSRIGWVPVSSFRSLRSSAARSIDHSALRSRPNSSIDYGAPLSAGVVTATGCNASQITFTNTSSLGLAIALSQDVPTARLRSGIEVWGGTKLYIEPGDTAVLTFITDEPRAWYFAGLDADLQAQASREADGTLIVDETGRAEASNAQRIDLTGGTCVYVPVFDPNDPDTYGYTPDGEAPPVIPEEPAVDETADQAATDEAAADGGTDTAAPDGAAADDTTTTDDTGTGQGDT